MPQINIQTKSLIRPNPKAALRRFIESFENFIESMEYANPAFWKDIEASRKSGRVSAKTIEKRLGIK